MKPSSKFSKIFKFFLFIFLLAFTTQVRAQKYFDVVKFGAIADGKSDNSKAISKAWSVACQSGGANVVVIPAGVFMIGPTVFVGPCNGPIGFMLQGTLRAPTDESSRYQDHWITFQYLDTLTVNGGGSFDGQGPSAWPHNNCSQDPNCKPLPVSIRFNFVNNSLVNHITSLNSKSFHMCIFACNNLQLDHIRILAPENSPNTDGIHIGDSSNIHISNSVIATGDDCVSLGPGSKYINVTNFDCGPGHGISVGSIGKIPGAKDVVGLHVRNCTMKDTLNGVRIKTWAPSYPSGVSDLTFEHINMINVYNPIIIDQHYCPSGQCSKEAASSVEISNVKFRNIWGTSNVTVAVDFECSKSKPCKQIELRDINLVGNDGQPTKALCSNVQGEAYGQQVPPSCV